MKTRFIVLVFLLFFLEYSNGQNYNPLAVDGAHWIVRLDQFGTPQPVDGLWEYYTNGDTVINSNTYKKVYSRNLIVTQNGPPFEAAGTYNLYGCVRDDLSTKKVYAIAFNANSVCPSNEEYTLYDFSLAIGDTIRSCIVPFSDATVQNISTTSEFGFTTNLFQINGFGEPDALFEGIGSNFGLFEMMLAPFKKKEANYILHTFLYYYCRESPCTLFVSTPTLTATPNLSITPNPAKKKISFTGVTERDISLIKFYNQLGQLVFQVTDNFENIDISQLKPGIYILIIKSNMYIIGEKLVVE